MKEEYNILDPEGKVCWQVLYPEKNSTCSFVSFRIIKE